MPLFSADAQLQTDVRIEARRHVTQYAEAPDRVQLVTRRPLAHGASDGIVFIPHGVRGRSVKSACTLRKHGIDFVDAQSLWQDPDRLEIPARFTDEPRVQVIGRIGHRVWSAFTTIREGRVRIISVRRARDEEEACRQD